MLKKEESIMTTTTATSNSSSSSLLAEDEINDDNDVVVQNSSSSKKWPPFNPFVRHPTSLQAKILMVITGSILVPVRIVGALLTLSLGWIWANIALIGIGDDPSAHPYSPKRRKIVFGGFRILARILLFFYGYVWIQTVHHNNEAEEDKSSSNNNDNDNDDTTETTQQQQQKEPSKEQPKIVVCNHTGFVELLYLAYAYDCSFVSKAENRSLPFIGYICQAMQCIFVERHKGGANNTSQKIHERTRTTTTTEEAQDDDGNQLWPLLCIAPEGTTTTGHCLISFRTGAFRPNVPIAAIATEMTFNPNWGYDPSFSCANIGLHVLGLMSQPYNHLKVHHLPVYVPNDSEKLDPQLFATNVQNQLSKIINIPVYNELQWYDKLLYESSAKKRDIGEKLIKEKNGGILPPMPIFTKDAFGNDLTILTTTTSMSQKSNNKKEQ